MTAALNERGHRAELLRLELRNEALRESLARLASLIMEGGKSVVSHNPIRRDSREKAILRRRPSSSTSISFVR